MILAIDCGNTRLKWGLYRPGTQRPGDGQWVAMQSVPVTELSRAVGEWHALERPGAIVVSNVAGDAVREALQAALQPFATRPYWVQARASQCGVRNSYLQPEQLGADRWAALIGARARHGEDCLVVGLGTATTVDILTRDGLFAGGVILPGVDLMKRSLAERTARLPLATGTFSTTPRSTADAIETGCLLAQAGVIERMFAGLAGGAVCLVFGGASAAVVPLLRVPVRVVDNLVLEGLVHIALDDPAKT